MSYRHPRRSSPSSTGGCIALIGFALGGLLVLGSCGASAYYNEHSATCAVTGKDRGAGSDGNSHYRVYTAQCGVLADEDSLLRGKTNSADIWSEITVGHTYRFRIVGYRLGLTSDFPNILAVEQEVRRG